MTLETEVSRLSDLMLNDRGFVFDPNTGESYQVSTTGLHCLRGLQRGATVEDLVAELVEACDVERITVRCDMDAFLWNLKQIGWL